MAIGVAKNMIKFIFGDGKVFGSYWDSWLVTSLWTCFTMFNEW